jgi:hypothetical protein
MDMKEIKMTEEEQWKREAEIKLNELDSTGFDFDNWSISDAYERGYCDCAESREKHISCLTSACENYREEMEKNLADATELEKENAELKEKLEGAEKARDYWKDSSFDWRHKCTSRKPFRAAVKAQKQLTKAKEIIGELFHYIPSWTGKENDKPRVYAMPDELRAKAEQFLKD